MTAEVVNIKEVQERVFGRDFNNPCNDPNVIECRLWDCQKANKCQLRGDRRLIEVRR